MTLYAISEVRDKEQILAFLEEDAEYTAYARGDLEPPYENLATWFAASTTGEISGLALVLSIASGPILFLCGDVPALSALLLYGIGPDNVSITAPTGTLDVLEAFYVLKNVQTLYRMRVTSGTFMPTSREPGTGLGMRTLLSSDVPAISDIIRATEEYDDRPIGDIVFTETMLEDGFYVGIFDGDRLDAMAGTHLTAPRVSIAAVGNVMVRPERRQQGLGRLMVQAVTAKLLESGFQFIVLNVEQRNGAAIRLYKQLGYRHTATFVEADASRH